MAIWFYFFYKVSVELPAVVEAIPQAELDARVLQNSTYLTVDILAEIIDPILLNTRINEVFILAREIYDFHAVLRGFFFGYFFILIMKFFKTFQAEFDACLKECLTICYPLTYRVSTIFFFIHFRIFFVDQYAPHLCLFCLVGNAKKTASYFLLAEFSFGRQGKSSAGYRGANDQPLFCKCRPLCHCFLGHLSMLCLCWSFPFGP